MGEFQYGNNTENIIVQKQERKFNFYKRLKRGFDIVFSSVGLILALPIVAIFCVIIRLESKGSPMFSQDRVGLDNKEFKMYKVRSMRNDAEKHGATWAAKNDERVTRVGKFIRLTRIDELPQLINVLKGDMSVIGPRPEREVFYQEFEKTIPNFRDRLEVRPGITGWAQINGGYEMSPEEKLRYDKEYIDKISIGLDLKIAFKTIWVMLTGHGAR